MFKISKEVKEKDLKYDIEQLSIKYVSATQLKEEAEERLEKYIKWKKDTIKDLKEIIFYLEKHLKNKDNLYPVIEEINKIIDRSIH